MGKLEGFGKQMEAVNKKMEEAQKSGDPNKQLAAAMEGVGTVLGGGKRYEPVAYDALKAVLPESVGGLARTGQEAGRGGPPGLEVSKARVDFGDGASKQMRLEVIDTGGAGGLMALAGWATTQSERESGNVVERTRREGDRVVHERISKAGGESEYTVVVGNRFMVSAEGRGFSIDELKGAVGAVNLAKLESMKDAGPK